jgi:hypothetical protein
VQAVIHSVLKNGFDSMALLKIVSFMGMAVNLSSTGKINYSGFMFYKIFSLFENCSTI